MIISVPGRARPFLENLRVADPDRDVVETLTGSDSLARTLAAFVDGARRHGPVHGSTRTYQLWAGTVARYSFDTYDLFTGPSSDG